MNIIPHKRKFWQDLQKKQYFLSTIINRTYDGDYEFCLATCEKGYLITKKKVFKLGPHSRGYACNNILYYRDNNGELKLGKLEKGKPFQLLNRYTQGKFIHVSYPKDIIFCDGSFLGSGVLPLPVSFVYEPYPFIERNGYTSFTPWRGDYYDGEYLFIANHSGNGAVYIKSKREIPWKNCFFVKQLGYAKIARFLNKDKAVFLTPVINGFNTSCFQLSTMTNLWNCHSIGDFITALAIDEERVAVLTTSGVTVLPDNVFINFNCGKILDFCLSTDRLVASVFTTDNVVEIDL